MSIGVLDSERVGTESVRGRVVEIEFDHYHENVMSFTLESGSRRYEIRAPFRIKYGFDLRHLVDHQVSREPIVVIADRTEEGLTALSIQDAQF